MAEKVCCEIYYVKPRSESNALTATWSFMFDLAVNHKLPFPLLTSVLLVPGRSGGGPVRRRGGIKAAAPEVEAGTSHVESQSSFPALQLSPDLDFFPPSEPKIASCAWSMPAKHPSCDDLRVLSIEKTERGGVYEPSETQDGEFWDPFEADWQRLLHGFDFKTMLGYHAPALPRLRCAWPRPGTATDLR